jgi:hypothetical protein
MHPRSYDHGYGSAAPFADFDAANNGSDSRREKKQRHRLRMRTVNEEVGREFESFDRFVRI